LLDNQDSLDLGEPEESKEYIMEIINSPRNQISPIDDAINET